MPPVQLEVIVRLKKRIAEFGVGDTLAFDAALDGFLRKQGIHGEVLADVAHEFNGAKRCQPLRIVGETSRRGRAAEVKEARQLLADAADVSLNLLSRK